MGERLARTLAAAPASRSVSAESFSKLAAAFPQSVRQALLEAYGQAAIRDISRAEVSIMPSGLDQNMSHQERADLIAFLESLK
ncbi:MAG: hypothetical protein OSB65_01780 [Roseibacillus sp.]|nr:hypothetical protein [Roseibacillus sp.]